MYGTLFITFFVVAQSIKFVESAEILSIIRRSKEIESGELQVNDESTSEVTSTTDIPNWFEDIYPKEGLSREKRATKKQSRHQKRQDSTTPKPKKSRPTRESYDPIHHLYNTNFIRRHRRSTSPKLNLQVQQFEHFNTTSNNLKSEANSILNFQSNDETVVPEQPRLSDIINRLTVMDYILRRRRNVDMRSDWTLRSPLQSSTLSKRSVNLIRVQLRSRSNTKHQRLPKGGLHPIRHVYVKDFKSVG